MGVSFSISTDVIASVAKWAHGDPDNRVHVVAFRDGRMEATDGHRLVSVPVISLGKVRPFGVDRAHLIAACAAQTAIQRDDMEPRVDHDLAEIGGILTPADGPYGDRELRFTLDKETVVICVEPAGRQSTATLRVPARGLSKFPAASDFASILREETKSKPVTGYVLQPRYLAAIDEVNTATGCRGSGVRCVAWGDPPPAGRDPIVFMNEAEARFAIMPMIPWAEGS